jgi:hypothetical protein
LIANKPVNMHGAAIDISRLDDTQIFQLHSAINDYKKRTNWSANQSHITPTPVKRARTKIIPPKNSTTNGVKKKRERTPDSSSSSEDDKPKKFVRITLTDSSSSDEEDNIASSPVEKLKKLKMEKKAIPVTIDKKPIVEGITHDELYQGYYLPELKEWCKEKNIKTSGSQRDLIKRILAFLSGDETVMKGYRKKKRKKDSKTVVPFKKIGKKKVAYSQIKKESEDICSDSADERPKIEKKPKIKKKEHVTLEDRVAKYATELNTLWDMGFVDQILNVRLLEQFNGSIDRVISYLVGTPLLVQTRRKDKT